MNAPDAFRRSVDKRRYFISRFVRRGASYSAALFAARKLFPLAPRSVELLPVEDRPSRQEAA